MGGAAGGADTLDRSRGGPAWRERGGWLYSNQPEVVCAEVAVGRVMGGPLESLLGFCVLSSDGDMQRGSGQLGRGPGMNSHRGERGWAGRERQGIAREL